MVVRLVMLFLSWSLGVGQTAGNANWYVKVKPPGFTSWKTVGSTTYAKADPTALLDEGRSHAFVAWVHKSQGGTVVNPRLADVAPNPITSTTTITSTLLDLGKLTVLDVTPLLERTDTEFRACFAVSDTQENCWIHPHGADAPSWQNEGLRMRTIPAPIKKLYLPFVMK
jgi:hypothetical protein